MTEVFLYDAIRTPFGRYGGALSHVRPDDLGAGVVRALLDRSPALDPARIGEVTFGNANGAGEDNRNVGRMVALLAGLPTTLPASTVNRLCGSSLEAVIAGAREVALGEEDLVLVGGVESMSRAPWVVMKPEKGFATADTTMVSTTLGWRLVNPAMPPEWTVSLGEATEQLGEREHVDRRAQDEFALASHRNASAAWASGFYDDLVVPVPGVDLSIDESIRADTTPEKLAGLSPAFRPDGTVTAGNASPLNDGASAAFIGAEAAARHLGRDPMVRIVSWAAAAGEPQFFGFAPVAAANRALDRAGISWDDIDAVEINEAFAAQSLACIDAWGVDHSIVNACGGAIAIGHPLGASGTRILGTLAKRLQRDGGRWGVATICIGVGQGLAVVVETV